jgi:uncharacterized protein YcnI
MRISRPTKAVIGTLLATATAVTATAMPASAHMSIATGGTTFTAGATNVIYFRVPHGCADPDKVSGSQAFNARTTAVTVNIPATGVASVKPEKKPGWDVSVVRNGALAVTQITWTARTADDALYDWTFADFGMRATLSGVEGDVIAFQTEQTCAMHDDSTPISPALSEPWTGVNAPKLTLVSSANAVTNAADLANLKSRVIALETSVSGALTSIGNLLSADTALGDRITSTESSIASLRTSVTSLSSESRLGWVRAKVEKNGSVGLLIDAPTVLRNTTATIKVNDAAVGTVQLNAIGDFVGSLSATDSASYTKGATVKVYVAGTLVAQGKVR